MEESNKIQEVADTEVKAKVSFKPIQVRTVGARVLIEYPQSPEQVLQIVSAPEGGVIQVLQKEVLDALKYFKSFSPMEKMHCWVETLSSKGDKALKHRNEYRTPLEGREQEQVKEMLGNLPTMTQKLSKSISKSTQGKVRFGFTFGVVTGEDIAVEIERPKSVVNAQSDENNPKYNGLT